MIPRRIHLRLPAVAAAVLLLGIPLAAVAAPQSGDVAAVQPTVVDNAVHDVGRIGLNVTNHGLIGVWPGAAGPYAGLPSLRYPMPDGQDHLYGAGVWIGGVLLGERLVSTGQYQQEIRATDDDEDRIYASYAGAPGGLRYPDPDADDDGDGLEDEDPLDGRDNDLDGLVDEDFAGISNQHFQCTMVDNTALAQETYPDHTPLNLEVVQRSFQWAEEAADGFVGFEVTVRNIGVVTIEDVFAGIFADFDLPAGGAPGSAEDDAAGYWEGQVPGSDGSLLDVSVAYMLDRDPVSPLPSYAGVALLDHTVDPLGQSAPAAMGVRSFQVFNGQAAFEQGGDPTNDAERYQALGEDMIDGNTPEGQSGDYRVLLSCGPFASLAPDQEITYAFAMVAGEGLDGLLESAAEAALTYRGLRFDRDGDPETGPDGKEYAVHWLSPGEVAVSAVSGSLLAARRDGGVRLEIEARHADVADLAVERRSAQGATERRWELADLADLVATPFGARASLTDVEAAGAARYALLHETGGGAAVLAEAQVAAPAARLELVAQPNPFNPRVELSFRLSQAGAVRLEIFSARGEKVRTLLSRSLPAGPFTAFWEGEDDAGGAVASGVYLVRLEAPEGRLLKRLTLLR